MVDEEAAWPRKYVDTGADAVRVQALRAELETNTVRSLFATTHELAELVATAVTNATRPPAAGEQRQPGLAPPDVQLRTHPAPSLPETPYPLLGPYEHPATFAGRDHECAELERRVRQPQLVLCLHAPSGAGKSSILLAGLAPHLRAQGCPVSVERHPGEPGLARRLVADLLALPADTSLADDDPRLFAEFAGWIAHAHAAAKTPPILILDQVDDFLREDDRREEALARLGPLMAATARRSPDGGGYPCRWVLCYRHEFHGEVDQWLRDVLLQAQRAERAGLEELPHDLHPPDRFHSWVIPLMGTPPPGEAAYPIAQRAFLDAIERPLLLKTDGGERQYGETFSGDGAQRLADAFARARLAVPNAPLVPELQIVLGHLLGQATSGPDGARLVAVSDDAEALDAQIDDALAAHLRRALTEAFPSGRSEAVARRGRAQAVAVLRELADDHGRRGRGLTKAELAGAFSSDEVDGEMVIETLASPGVRLITVDADSQRYGLSHDRLAEVVTAFYEEERSRGDLGVDDRLVEAQKLVTQRSQAYQDSRDPQMLRLTGQQFRLIAHSATAFRRDDVRRGWWSAARGFRRRQQNLRWAGVAVVAGLITVGAFVASQQRVAARNTETCGSPGFSADMWCLPNDPLAGFVVVPAGPFLMGSDQSKDDLSYDNEVWPNTPTGQKTLELPEFYIGRYEVTVAQFRAYDAAVDALYGGAGLGARAEPDFPMTDVSWDEALAYTQWLDQTLRRDGPDTLKARLDDGLCVTLPSEAEWEKAARGDDGRIWPWGNTQDAPDGQPRGNFNTATTRRVGSFDCPECLYGLADMAGNVWEWTRSPWVEQYPSTDGRGTLTSDLDRVLRGGSFLATKRDVRAAYRNSFNPDFRFSSIGFRVVVSPFFSDLCSL